MIVATPTIADVPDGFAPIAWATFPSLHGPWRPSRIHLCDSEWGPPLCGARRSRYAHNAKTAGDFQDHAKDAGWCARCARIVESRTGKERQP
jgi:hypothetical protein